MKQNRTRRWGLALASLTMVSTLALSTSAQTTLPSFPGAEGFGAVASGGRGGQVIKVTTLASSGPGSLQEALDTPGPRIIVFDVSGVIDGDHWVNHSDVTIAGQTAPGAGITIAGRLFGKYDDSVQNIIVRHIRVRPSYAGQTGNLFDAVQFSKNSRLMFDHVSASWGVDETFDLYEADDVTVQYSTITESATSGHPEGMHNYGLINGPDGHRISLHHNLFAHHKNRAPAIANGPAEVINNVMYNVRHGFVHHNPASGQFNITGNLFIQGPNDSLYPFWFDDETWGSDPSLAYHLADNFIDDPGDFVGVVDDPWLQPVLHPSFQDMYMPANHYAAAPFDFSTMAQDYHPVSSQTSSETLDTVLDYAGAFPRDVVTQRILSELQNRGGSWGVDKPSDLMAGLQAQAPPVDTDGDGMPDDWENGQGLNPADGSDHTTVMASGYTAIEDYINERALLLTGSVPVGPGGEGGGAPGSGGAGGGDLGAGGDDGGYGGSGGSDVGLDDFAGRNGGSEEPGDDELTCSLGEAPPADTSWWPLALVGLGLAWSIRRRR